VGLYSIRNTTVTFSDVNLNIFPTVPLGEWEYSRFGSDTSDSKNPPPTFNSNDSVTLEASGGKIDGSNEGISFYYNKLPADSNFEIVASAAVKTFNSNSAKNNPGQKSFGLMLKDEPISPSNYILAGALDEVMKAAYKQGSQKKLDSFDVNTPAANEVYDLSIRKSGDAYVLNVNGESQIIDLDSLFSDDIYVGFYVARDAEVTFSDFAIRTDARKANEINVDLTSIKTYLVGESLDLSGAKATSVIEDVYGNTSEINLDSFEFIATGFDSSEAGSNTITLHFNGATTTVDLEIIPLTVTRLEIQYYPAKTVYYLDDPFDPEGFTIIADYNTGVTEELTTDKYTFSIPGVTVTEATYLFNSSGTHTVEVISTETPDMSVSFDVEVKDTEIMGLEIRQLPEKSQYYIGEQLDLDGMVVYAKYNDNTEVSTFTVNVKVKEFESIKVTQYPKTTYMIDEDFDSSGLEVSNLYDNSDLELLNESEYTVNSSNFDNSSAGTYVISIEPDDTNIDAITFQVTVRENTGVEWNMIRFGQSTSSANNVVTENDDGSVRLEALGGSAGKVTGDHDGISYYYTIIDVEEDNFELSANIKVIEYAKPDKENGDPAHDGQESFGIMARDAIGTAGDSSVFASNIAAVGGYSGGTGNDNGTQLFARTGIESSDGAGSQGIQKIMLNNEKPTAENTHPAEEYRLTLAKTNSGYIGKFNSNEEEIIFEPDILNVQDSNIYVGFYAARLATIEVSDIDFSVTAAATDAPKVEPPAEAVTPSGTYVRSSHINIKKYNDGTEDAKKSLVAAAGASPVIDFDKKSEGVLLSGNYWHIKGLSFTRSAGNTKGFVVGGSYNIVEESKFYENGDTGLQISRTDITENDKSKWPSYNLILNSTSFDNRDPSDNNADGFAAKLTSGEGNVFRGAIAHNNIDDGWNLYTKAGSGAIGAVLIEDSIAYNNGFLTDGTEGNGDKNGFKLGGEGIHVPHIIRNSMAFGNGAIGFTSNSNPGVIAEDNIAFNNAGGNLVFTTYSGIETDFTLNGFISYQKDYTARDKYPEELEANNNYLFNGSHSVNKAGKRLSDSNFKSLVPVETYQRDDEGNIIWGDFLKFVSTGNDSGGGSGIGSGSGADVEIDGSVTIKPVVTTNNTGGKKVVIDNTAMQDAIAKGAANAHGKKVIRIEIPDEDSADTNEFEVNVPASTFNAASSDLQIEVKTQTATVVLPVNMFQAEDIANSQNIGLSIKKAVPSDSLKEKIGNRPVFEFNMMIDDEQVTWNNPNISVQISIPYVPVESEEADEEFIVVWYIDENGDVIPIVNGQYMNGHVHFSTTHFSQFAVTYHHKTFQDIENHWAQHEVDVMASKGIINGVSDSSFMPNHNIT
jgi:hypothetical protein